MKELSIPYSLERHVLDLPRELAYDLDVALLGEGINQQNALDALNFDHREFVRDYFRTLLDETYQGLQKSVYERRALLSIMNQRIQRLIHTVGAFLVDVPEVSRWAYPLILSRGWTVLDLVLGAHRGINYEDKRRVSLMQANHYPALVEMFEQPGLKLSGLEAEVLADITYAAGAEDYFKVFGTARELVAAIPESRLGGRTSPPTRLGSDFVDMVLSIRYTKPMVV
ncbi:MAG: hypothetical protein Q8R11_03690 [bacterium]|nr:hypothetical protein [bacterium]